MVNSENPSQSNLEIAPNTNILQMALKSGLSVIAAYTPSGLQVVQEASDQRRVEYDIWGINTACDTGKNFNTFLRTINGANIYEIALIRPLDKPVMAKRTIVTSKGFLGVGHKTREESYEASRIPLKAGDAIAGSIYKDEPAVALDYYATDGGANKYEERLFRDWHGRPGNYLTAEVILPQSIAKLISEEIRKDPRFIRVLVDAFVEQKYPKDFVQGSWMKYARPPYQAWDLRPERKIYFADLIKNPEKAHLPPSKVIEGAISY